MVHLAAGITIGALYILISRFAITFATELDINAGLAIWLPNIGFSIVAVLLVMNAQK